MKYKIGNLIGSGSFGTVYEAHDDAGNKYAVKVVEPGDEIGFELLGGQFEFLSSFNHRRIVRPLDFDPYAPLGSILVTEFVPGVDLKTYVRTKGTRELATITAKIIDALRYMHSVGKLHGDLKPDNILVFDGSDGVEVKLVDLGFDFATGGSLPTLAGTLPYLAPEIIRNMPADGRSDLYSLGVALYEVLTGSCPFAGLSYEEILKKHLDHVPPQPSSSDSAIPSSWDTFIMTLLRKEPFLRYKDATHAGLELGNLLGNPGLLMENLVLPEFASLVGREAEIRRVGGLIRPPMDKCLMLYAERGYDVTGILKEIEAIAKSRGHKVFRAMLAKDMPTFAQVVESVLGDEVTIGDSPITPESGTQVDEGSLEEIIDAFQSRLSGDRYHLLLIDGGEAMGVRELQSLCDLAGRLGDLIGIVVGSRVEDCDEVESPVIDACESVEIRRLDRNEVEDVLKRHFDVSVVPQDLADHLYRITQGDPSFLQTALEELWNRGSIRLVPHQDALKVAWDRATEVPTSLSEIFRARLNRLSDPALEVMKIVCACPGQIEEDVLSDFLPASEVEASLKELIGSRLVTKTDNRISMRLRWEGLSEIVRDMTSGDWLRDTGLRLASIAKKKARTGRDQYRLGLLYLQGGRRQDAVHHLVQAGDYFAGFSPGDAILAYRKALQCDASADRRAAVQEKIGDLALARGDHESAMSYFKQAATRRLSALRKLGWVQALHGSAKEGIKMLNDCKNAALKRGDLAERARALCDLGHIHSIQSGRDESLRLLKEAQYFFVSHNMPLEAGSAANRIGIVEMRSGNFKSAASAWAYAKAQYEKAGSEKKVAIMIGDLALCYWKQMDFARAKDNFETAISRFERVKAPALEAAFRQNYALLLLDEGDLVAARKLVEEASRIHTLVGLASGILTSKILLAAVALEAGNCEEAENSLKDLLKPDYDADSFQQAMIKRYLSLAKAMKGEYQEAITLIDESYSLASDARDVEGQGQAMLAKSEILLRSGKREEALELASKAVTALSLTSSVLLAHVAQRVAGEALCMCGRIEKGIAELMAAKKGLEVIGESLHMARALRALAIAYYLSRDHASFEKFSKLSTHLFRKAGARYEYALGLLAAGREATRRGRFIQARHCLLEAGRIFETLGIERSYKEAVDEMETIPSGDFETKAVISLSKISQALNSSHDLATVLDLAMDLALEYLGAERGVLMLVDETSGALGTFVERKMDKESLDEVIGISRSIVESVRLTKEPVIARDASRDPRFKNSKSVRIHNIMSVMCVPLTKGEKLIGVIYLDNRGVPSDFTRLERAFVDAFANQVSLAIENASIVGRLQDDYVDLRARARQRYNFANIIGPGKKMQEVFRQVDKAAKSTITILITGESGTGKELIAGLLHELSPRRDKPLVTVNCAAIQKDLLETELFGIEKRVATGIAPRSGFFERANGGTVFLDEVGDMPLTTQMEVLRVLDEKKFERVGGSRVLEADVRVISSTNQNLKELIRQGLFRRDLYYRLNAMHIHLPSLRERMEDLPYIVDFFLNKYAAENSKPPMQISKEALKILKKYSWPGNVRELEKCIEHAVVVADTTQIGVEHLPEEILESISSADLEAKTWQSGESLCNVVREVERKCIFDALRKARGVKTIAADLLGIHVSTLRKKIKTLGVMPADRSDPSTT